MKYLSVEEIDLLIDDKQPVNWDAMAEMHAELGKSEKLGMLLGVALRTDKEKRTNEAIKIAVFIGYQLGYAAASK